MIDYILKFLGNFESYQVKGPLCPTNAIIISQKQSIIKQY
jgi:hypothetical protein